jgi:hypothetical protein
MAEVNFIGVLNKKRCCGNFFWAQEGEKWKDRRSAFR